VTESAAGAAGTPFAALFPGQLSEKPGMGAALAARFDFCASTFEEVSRRSGVDLAGTFFGEGAPALHDDLPAQVGVFAVSVAALDALEREEGLVPSAVAGYSLGTYAACAAAGCLDRWAALDVLLEAQRLLAESRSTHASNPGGMGFVIGLSKAAVEAAIAGTAVAIGTENASRQFVLAGEARAVAEAVERLGPGALKAGVLPMGFAMHSSRLEAVCRSLRNAFEGRIRLSEPRLGLYAPMLGARIFRTEEVSTVLFGQLARPSLWAQTLGAMGADGYSLFAEVGPGAALTKLLRWTLREATGLVVESPESAAVFAAAASAPVAAGGKEASRA
jgi:[acyl-carrier-protein] S-malonyltransferase